MTSTTIMSVPSAGEENVEQERNMQTAPVPADLLQLAAAQVEIISQTSNAEGVAGQQEISASQPQSGPEAPLTDSNDTRRPATGQLHVQVRRPSPAIFIREQLFQALFHRLTLLYVRSVPPHLRRIVEFIFLFQALLSLCLLTYIHIAFVRHPADCLGGIRETWSHEGILRIDVVRNATSNYTLEDSYRKAFASRLSLGFGFDSSSIPSPEFKNSSIDIDIMEQEEEKDEGIVAEIMLAFRELLADLNPFIKYPYVEDFLVYEYSNEFGFLRLSPKTRNRLNISVTHVVLDPLRDECFGNKLSRVLLDEFLGYDDVILSSLQHLSTAASAGYAWNVETGAHYKFVSMSDIDSRWTYLSAFILLIVFTLSVSLLLRYSHHQIFTFIVNVLQSFNRTMLLSFPFAPLFIAVTALVGVETLMSRVFNAESTAFFVILVVWLADQYDVVCCHTNISRRHFPKFFFLYHFMFYAYHCRFQGQFSSVAMFTSWLFTQHAMIYFFHHYELPVILRQADVHRILVHHANQRRAAMQRLQATTDSANGAVRPETDPLRNNTVRPETDPLRAGGDAFITPRTTFSVHLSPVTYSARTAGGDADAMGGMAGLEGEAAATRRLVARWLDVPAVEVANYLIVSQNVTLLDVDAANMTTDGVDGSEDVIRNVTPGASVIPVSNVASSQVETSSSASDNNTHLVTAFHIASNSNDAASDQLRVGDSSSSILASYENADVVAAASVIPSLDLPSVEWPAAVDSDSASDICNNSSKDLMNMRIPAECINTSCCENSSSIGSAMSRTDTAAAASAAPLYLPTSSIFSDLTLNCQISDTDISNTLPCASVTVSDDSRSGLEDVPYLSTTDSHRDVAVDNSIRGIGSVNTETDSYQPVANLRVDEQQELSFINTS